ncbi:MAG: hypothetical protein ACRD8W_29375, partial [Nitrososphaeraceae archaeon]
NPIQRPLSYNAKKALLKGAIVGAITSAVYLTVVVLTTPNLPPSAAINAALTVNGIIIFGLAVGVGIQIFASSYSKGLGCRIGDRKKYQPKKGVRKFLYLGHGGSGGSGGSTAVSSFLSFFSLVPLGCCGSWLYILSMLPSVFGGTLSVVLIKYSTLLSYVGLAVVIGFAALSVLRLRKEMNEYRMIAWKSLGISDNDDDDRNAKVSLPDGAERGLSS